MDATAKVDPLSLQEGEALMGHVLSFFPPKDDGNGVNVVEVRASFGRLLGVSTMWRDFVQASVAARFKCNVDLSNIPELHCVGWLCQHQLPIHSLACGVRFDLASLILRECQTTDSLVSASIGDPWQFMNPEQWVRRWTAEDGIFRQLVEESHRFREDLAKQCPNLAKLSFLLESTNCANSFLDASIFLSSSGFSKMTDLHIELGWLGWSAHLEGDGENRELFSKTLKGLPCLQVLSLSKLLDQDTGPVLQISSQTLKILKINDLRSDDGLGHQYRYLRLLRLNLDCPELERFHCGVIWSEVLGPRGSLFHGQYVANLLPWDCPKLQRFFETDYDDEIVAWVKVEPESNIPDDCSAFLHPHYPKTRRRFGDVKEVSIQSFLDI